MKTLLYTFQNQNNITFKILRLKEFDKYDRYFISGLESTKQLMHKFIRDKYKYVIGFGDFSKRVKRIRIETKFINRYGKSKIILNAHEYYNATLNLPIKPLTYKSNATSNGPCNRSAFLLSHNTKINNINAKINFIHIPSSFNINKAKMIILSWIKELNKV